MHAGRRWGGGGRRRRRRGGAGPRWWWGGGGHAVGTKEERTKQKWFQARRRRRLWSPTYLAIVRSDVCVGQSAASTGPGRWRPRSPRWGLSKGNCAAADRKSRTYDFCVERGACVYRETRRLCWSGSCCGTRFSLLGQLPRILETYSQTITTMCKKASCDSCRRFLFLPRHTWCLCLTRLLDKTTWWGCGNHIAGVMESVPSDQWCTCGPRIEKEGHQYPPMGTLSSA